MIKTLPAALVGLTALVTTVLVHAVFAVWWMVEAYGKANPPPFDWVGSLATSGIATAAVLGVGLLVQRRARGTGGGVVADEAPPAPSVRPVPRPASEATVVVTTRRRVTPA